MSLVHDLTDDSLPRPSDATYKEYQKLRDILDGKIPPPPTKSYKDKENCSPERKRKSPNQPSQTPSTKRFCAAPTDTPSSRQYHALNPLAQFTPSADRAGDAVLALAAATPSLSRKLFSPAVPTSIGPTPQRDGRVLGLFDALPFKDAEIDSPCKPNGAARPSQATSSGREATIEETPRASRRTMDVLGGSGGGGAADKLDRTPSSRHKRRQQLQSPRTSSSIPATPLKLHDGNRVAKTPGTSSSVSKLQFQTPAFLRRIPMAQISEADSAYKSPEPIRLPRKPLLRGLSSVVADLRRLQEAELDDDLDALREMESGDAPLAKSGPAQHPQQNDHDSSTERRTADKKKSELSILAEDAEKQNLGLLGGFDDEGQYDSPDETGAGLDRSGQPLKVYKKKGQKRTTRRSNMRPVKTRRPATDNNDNEKPPPASPSKTLVPDVAAEGDKLEDPALLSGSEFATSDDDEDELAKDFDQPIKNTRKAPVKKAVGAAGDDKKAKPGGTTVVKKAARKVNELAHANFKRLKLRNNGAKGGPGYNSRFRRRR